MKINIEYKYILEGNRIMSYCTVKPSSYGAKSILFLKE